MEKRRHAFKRGGAYWSVPLLFPSVYGIDG
jgi:hypothetical protein